MKGKLSLALFAALLTVLASSVARSQDASAVWIGGHLLLRVRCPAGGYTIEERAAAVQRRTNDLLRGGRTTLTVTVRKSDTVASIYTDDVLLITVTPADAKVNGTTPMKLAGIWAARLRDLFPQATPDKPPSSG